MRVVLAVLLLLAPRDHVADVRSGWCDAVAEGSDGNTLATRIATSQAFVAVPLAAMPSAPGPHLDKIKAMDNDSWLDLGKPAPDPRWGMGYGRSYQPNLSWAPDLKCAFILGTGVHGATHKYPDGVTRWENDVWAYDLWGHRWICLYPGIDVSNGTYKVDARGGATTEDGRGSLEGSHAYQHSCYDPISKRFVIGVVDANTDYFPKRLKEEFYKDGARGPAEAKHWAPFVYDPVADDWKLHHPTGAVLRGKGSHAVFYSPKLKRVVAVSPDSLYEYEMDKEEWIKRPVRNTAKIGYSIGCYDTKRDRIIFAGTGPAGNGKDAPGALGALDVSGGEVRPLNSEGLVAGFGALDWMSGPNLMYDAANDAVVLTVWCERLQGMYIYDCATDTWLPKRALGIPPRRWQIWSGFYVPELNVHIFHESMDSGCTDRILAYRFKKNNSAEELPNQSVDRTAHP